MAQSSQSWELFDAFIAQAAAFLGMIAFYLDDLGTENSDIACGSFFTTNSSDCGETVAAMVLEDLKNGLDNTQPSEGRTYFIRRFRWWAVTLPTLVAATIAE